MPCRPLRHATKSCRQSLASDASSTMHPRMIRETPSNGISPATAHRVFAKGASEPRCPSLRGIKRFGRGEVNRHGRQAGSVLAKPSPGVRPDAPAPRNDHPIWSPESDPMPCRHTETNSCSVSAATAHRVFAKGASEPRCPSLRGIKRFGRGEVNRHGRQAGSVLAKPSPGARPDALSQTKT